MGQADGQGWGRSSALSAKHNLSSCRIPTHSLSLRPQQAHSERWAVVKAVHPNMNATIVYYITTTVKHVQGYRSFSTDCGLCEWQVSVRPNKKPQQKQQEPNPNTNQSQLWSVWGPPGIRRVRPLMWNTTVQVPKSVTAMRDLIDFHQKSATQTFSVCHSYSQPSIKSTEANSDQTKANSPVYCRQMTVANTLIYNMSHICSFRAAVLFCHNFIYHFIFYNQIYYFILYYLGQNNN